MPLTVLSLVRKNGVYETFSLPFLNLTVFILNEGFRILRVSTPHFLVGDSWNLLDALAYVPQMLRLPASWVETQKWKMSNAAWARKINAPYSIGA